MRDAAQTGELFLASHLLFPALGRVLSWHVPVSWAYWRLGRQGPEQDGFRVQT